MTDRFEATGTAARMNREDRNRRFGVDCPDAVVWRHWGPGGEYLRKLILKNTHDKLQVIQYRLPRQKATFFVEFPEPVTLSSGMAYELVFRFRPTELKEHHDSIEIDVKGRGAFVIDLTALTPYSKLCTPEKHDFQFCPATAVSSTMLPISNGGTVPLEIEWDCPEPFSIEPKKASLAEGETLQISASFKPMEASAMVGQAVCRMTNGSEAGKVLSVMRLSGIGKYTFVRCLEDSHVDFGDILTSTVINKTLTIQNKSAVDAEYEIVRVDHDIVNPFVFHPTKGKIPRDGEIHVNIKYSPESTSAHYTNDFLMRTVGGNKLEFRCTGTASGPQVSLSCRVLDYGDVDLDGDVQPEKIIVLKNKSALPVEYHCVACDPGCAFVITPFTGTLGPKKLANLTVKFCPSAPINYLRRIHILIKHSDQALFIDCLGTAFNAKARPAPFSHKHVVYYMMRLASGLGRTTPDDIAELWNGISSKKPAVDEGEEAARLVLQHAAAVADKAFTDKREVLSDVLPADERFQLPFFLEETRVVFRKGATTEGRIVNVRNETSAKATAVWSVPAGAPWSVTPMAADVQAFEATSFKIKMRPDAPSTSFGHHLECFVFYKSMRSFRLVSEKTFAPSQCLALQCQCITPLTETSATPQVTVPGHVAFPACHQNGCVFQIIPLSNQGDTVAAFDIRVETHRAKHKKHQTIQSIEDLQQPDPEEEAQLTKSVFTFYPTCGTIPPSGTALVLCRFQPSLTTRFRGTAIVSFNESIIGTKTILLRGEGFVPEISLHNNSILPFRPTCVAGCTKRKYLIENPSRIPINFKIDIPENFVNVLKLEPLAASLKGCERMELNATFTPQLSRTYEMKIPITVSAENPPSPDEAVEKVQILHVIGDGVQGVVALEPLEVNFGDAMVGDDISKTITVFNSSLCDVQYQVRYVVKTSKTPHEGGAPPLKFMPNPQGVLRARSHVNINVTVKLPYRGDFAYTVYVVSGGSDALVDATQPTIEDIERLPHCEVSVSGSHPTLEITDVRSVYQRKSHLWRQLSVTTINSMLQEPTLECDTETNSFTFQQSCEGLAPIHCDLGVDVFRTAPIRVLLRFDNVGHAPVSFKFWFPHESEVPKEPWHQDEAIGDDDAGMAEIIDRRLFDVSPRNATVPVGGHVVVLFTYQHTKIGHHVLPVMLRLDQGKRLLLHLTARTLHESTRFLAFNYTLRHELQDVAIGDMEPPLQYTELQNLGHQPAAYSVDSEALQEVREKNYDFPIFQCLNPVGVIPPMSTLLLSWYFRPLEAKKYQVSAKIVVEGGETYMLQLAGAGYHPKKCTPAQIRAMHSKDIFPLPIFPTLRHPLLPLRLSMDVLRFSTVPFHSLHRQVISLQNSHPRDTFLFEWHCVLQYGDQLLDVDPPRGRVAAGESIQFRVTMYSGSTSHIIDNPIHCHVLNESLRERRTARREALEREAAMQLEQPADQEQSKSDGSLTGGSLTAAAREARKLKNAPRNRAPITTVPAKYQSTGRLRQAIQQLTEAAVAEELDDDDGELTYVDVLPTVLEVLVQARIMPLDSYKEIYGEKRAKSLYYPTLRVYSTPFELQDVPGAPNDLVFKEEEEKEEGETQEGDGATAPTTTSVLRDVLDGLLKQLVQDPRIIEAYTDISEDPVPYFCQMGGIDNGHCAEFFKDGNTVDVSQEQERQEEGRREAEGESGVKESGENVVASSSSEAVPPDDLASVQKDGDFQCLIEEVVEDLLYQIVAEANGEDGVFQRVANGGMNSAVRSSRVGNGGTQTTKRVTVSQPVKPIPNAQEREAMSQLTEATQKKSNVPRYAKKK